MVDALINDPSRSFWSEVKRIRNSNTGTSVVVYGCSDIANISQVFLHKYRQLYTSVPCDAAEMQVILTDVESQSSREAALSSDHICSPQEVASAISKLNPHKNDGGTQLSSDHLIFVGPDLPVHKAFLFTCITVHGFMPEDFLSSSFIPVAKKRGCNASASENFRGIALSSVFRKIFDNISVSFKHKRFAVWVKE